MEYPELSADLIKSGESYANLMAEVKRRVTTLTKMLTPAFFDQLSGGVALECCYLQLRMITELIALACLTVNGSAAGARSKGIRKETSADAIMNALEKIHPDFYPVPEKQIRNEDGTWKGGQLRVEGFIKRKELTAVYGTCGNILHVGNFNQLADRKPRDLDPHIKFLNETVAGIINLLQWHAIVTINPAIQLWTEMAPKNDLECDPTVKLVRIEMSDEFRQELSRLRGQADRDG